MEGDTYAWPSAAEWAKWTREQRVEQALKLLRQAVRNENRSHSTHRSLAVEQSLELADLALT